MKLLVQSAMIFFGTLMAAGLVALGEPGGWHSGDGARNLVHQLLSVQSLSRWVEPGQPWADPRLLTGWHE